MEKEVLWGVLFWMVLWEWGKRGEEDVDDWGWNVMKCDEVKWKFELLFVDDWRFD